MIHDDGYARTFTVAAGEFEVVNRDDGTSLQSSSGHPKITQCRVLEPPAGTDVRKTIKSLLEQQPYRGGCKDGRAQLARKGIADMDGVRIQVWDTTEAAWFSARILGCYARKKKTHWIVHCQDDTDYIIDARLDVWKLVRSQCLCTTAPAQHTCWRLPRTLQCIFRRELVVWVCMRMALRSGLLWLYIAGPIAAKLQKPDGFSARWSHCTHDNASLRQDLQTR